VHGFIQANDWELSIIAQAAFQRFTTHQATRMD
jgi:HD superfamily phosphohydrolase